MTRVTVAAHGPEPRTAEAPLPLLVTSSYAPHFGGVEEVVARLAGGLAERSGPPPVVTNRWPRTLARRETIAGITVHRSPFRTPVGGPRQLGTWLLGSAATRRAIRYRARAAGCAVVNVHCVSSNAEYVLDVSRILGLPLVVSLHGELTGDATGAYRHPRQRRLWAELMERASVVTAPSRYALSVAERVHGRPLGERGRVLRNGVGMAHPEGVLPSGEAPGGRAGVVGAGRLVEVKGFDLLVRAWARLSPRYPEHLLTLVGDGPQREDLQALARDLGVGRTVVFPGRLPHGQLQDRFRRAAVVAVPSREEALGQVAMEAMAAGAPVVASDAGGLPELVVPGRTGWLVPREDPAALAGAIGEVLDAVPDGTGPVAERVTGARGLVATLTWDAYVDGMRDCYRRAVRGG